MGFINKIVGGGGVHIRTTLVAGMLVMIPIVVTYVILRFIFDAFDPLLKDLLELVVPKYTPGMGIIALLIIIYLVGLVTTHWVGRRTIALAMGLVHMIPVVNSVYRAAHQATQVFSSVNSNGKFSAVVLVDFPGSQLKSIGLVTSTLKDQDGTNLLTVYMPTSPFPTSGFLVVLPEGRVTPTDIAVDDAMKMIVSVGIITPKQITTYPNPIAEVPRFTRDGGKAEKLQPADTEDSNQ